MSAGKVTLIALIAVFGMILSAGILSKFFVRIGHEQTISVKGFAEADASADIGKVTCTVRSRGNTMKESYEILQAGRDRILKSVREQGFSDAEVLVGTIDTSRVARRDAQGNTMNEVEFVDSSLSITVTSSNVPAVSAAASTISELVRENIDVSVWAPEFYVTGLQDLKMDLLRKATADGRRRAETLVAGSGGRVGSLVSAEQGVFQITTRNSTETSGYGMYDTSTVDKTVKAVVTMVYAIEQEKQAPPAK